MYMCLLCAVCNIDLQQDDTEYDGSGCALQSEHWR
jgi:hypothetical protein